MGRTPTAQVARNLKWTTASTLLLTEATLAEIPQEKSHQKSEMEMQP